MLLITYRPSYCVESAVKP